MGCDAVGPQTRGCKTGRAPSGTCRRNPAGSLMPPWNLHRHPSKASSLQCFALPPLSADVLGVVLNKVPKRDTQVRLVLVSLCAACLLHAHEQRCPSVTPGCGSGSGWCCSALGACWVQRASHTCPLAALGALALTPAARHQRALCKWLAASPQLPQLYAPSRCNAPPLTACNAAPLLTLRAGHKRAAVQEAGGRGPALRRRHPGRPHHRHRSVRDASSCCVTSARPLLTLQAGLQGSIVRRPLHRALILPPLHPSPPACAA